MEVTESEIIPITVDDPPFPSIALPIFYETESTSPDA